jgi:hypothetical protein
MHRGYRRKQIEDANTATARLRTFHNLAAPVGLSSVNLPPFDDGDDREAAPMSAARSNVHQGITSRRGIRAEWRMLQVRKDS